jgi:hypothetical protein
MNERYIEVQTLAKRNLPEAARAFLQQLTDSLTGMGEAHEPA